MAKSWERMIRILGKILDALLLNSKATELNHEVFCTFIYEDSALIKCRPICPMSIDTVRMNPSMLLTQKDANADLMSVDFY